MIGNVKEPVKVVANWKSNLTASALIADTANEQFRLASPTPLENGGHTVYITAYRLSDNAQSKTISLKFNVSDKSNWWLYLIASLAILLLLIALYYVRKRRLTTQPANTTEEPPTKEKSLPQEPKITNSPMEQSNMQTPQPPSQPTEPANPENKN